MTTKQANQLERCDRIYCKQLKSEALVYTTIYVAVKNKTVLLLSVRQVDNKQVVSLNPDEEVEIIGKVQWYELYGLFEPSVYNPITDQWTPWTQINKD